MIQVVNPVSDALDDLVRIRSGLKVGVISLTLDPYDNDMRAAKLRESFLLPHPQLTMSRILCRLHTWMTWLAASIRRLAMLLFPGG